MLLVFMCAVGACLVLNACANAHDRHEREQS